MGCPDERQLLAWGNDGTDDPPGIAAHVEQCADCQLKMTALQTKHATDSTLGELPALGTVLNDRYRLVQHVGAGAMGVVFRCFDVELEREVALKLVKGSPDADARRTGLDEARSLARLNHPNVVAVYDAFPYGAWDAIAMEFVLGEDVRHWMRTPHSRAEVEQLFLQATLGLEAAHLAGVVHRDFKPENVLVGQDGRVRVSDFGLSRSHARLGGATGLTTTPAGTPAYMAPELMRWQPATSASDQYALCLTAIEALTGERTPDTSLRLMPWSRGVNADPARRWGSLTELREALTTRARRRRVTGIAGLLVFAVVLALGIAQLKPPAAPAACAALSARAATLAAPSSLSRFQAALSPKLPALSTDRVLQLMAGHLDSFEQLRWGACRPERDAARAQLQTARLACLERTLFDLESIHRGAVEGAERSSLATIGYELLGYDPRQRCADDRRVRAQALTATPASDTGLDREVEAFVKVWDAHDLGQVRPPLDALLARARQANASWALATLLSMRANLQHDAGDLDAARADLEEGISIAEAEGLDLISFTLTRDRMSFARSAEDMQSWLELARVRAVRLGNGAVVEGDLLEASGIGLWNVGDLGGAAERFHEAAKAWRALLTADDAMVGQVEQLEGRALAELGRFDEALPLLAHAEQVTGWTLGPDSIRLLDDWAALARLELLRERPLAARGYLERARVLRIKLGREPDEVEQVAWRWLSSLEGAKPEPLPSLDDGSETALDLVVIEELEHLAGGDRLVVDAKSTRAEESPMRWLATAVAARRTADQASARRVVDAPVTHTGKLARANALVVLGRRQEALELVDERLLSPQRPVAK